MNDLNIKIQNLLKSWNEIYDNLLEEVIENEYDSSALDILSWCIDDLNKILEIEE